MSRPCGCCIREQRGWELHIMYCSLHRAAPKLLAALEKLTAECGSLQEQAIREGIGNTNAAVFALRVREARAVIAQITPR